MAPLSLISNFLDEVDGWEVWLLNANTSRSDIERSLPSPAELNIQAVQLGRACSACTSWAMMNIRVNLWKQPFYFMEEVNNRLRALISQLNHAGWRNQISRLLRPYPKQEKKSSTVQRIAIDRVTPLLYTCPRLMKEGPQLCIQPKCEIATKIYV